MTGLANFFLMSDRSTTKSINSRFFSSLKPTAGCTSFTTDTAGALELLVRFDDVALGVAFEVLLARVLVAVVVRRVDVVFLLAALDGITAPLPILWCARFVALVWLIYPFPPDLATVELTSGSSPR